MMSKVTSAEAHSFALGQHRQFRSPEICYLLCSFGSLDGLLAEVTLKIPPGKGLSLRCYLLDTHRFQVCFRPCWGFAAKYLKITSDCLKPAGAYCVSMATIDPKIAQEASKEADQRLECDKCSGGNCPCTYNCSCNVTCTCSKCHKKENEDENECPNCRGGCNCQTPANCTCGAECLCPTCHGNKGQHKGNSTSA